MAVSVSMGVVVPVPVIVVVPMGVPVVMSVVMMMAKSHHSNHIHSQTQTAHDEELTEPLRLRTLPESLKRLKRDLHAEKPDELLIRVLLLQTLIIQKRKTYMRRMPLAKPLNVSILPNPYGNLWLGGHLLITAANSPTSNATQSKNM